ncbi:MAG: FtsX-like permease family protein [Anaerolineae bacterium]|nr:ABC transporter permease [Caldilineales bacterium]MDW8269739.1 FtsX-like permease family protein [Anaerolineae bacterium]
MWKLALRNVFRHRLRTAMTLTVIVIGVVGLILTGGFVRDIYHQLGEMLIHSQSGHLQIARQGYFERGTRSPEKFLIEETEWLRATVAAVGGVRAVMGRLYLTGLLNNGRTDLPVIGEGIEPEGEGMLGSRLVITQGRRLEPADRYGIMLGEGLARTLKLTVGDWATLVVHTADGALNTQEFEVVGIFRTFSKEYDARAIRIPLTVAQELLAIEGMNTLVVLLDDTRHTETVAAAVRGLSQVRGLEVRTWPELNEFYAQTVRWYDGQFGVLRFIILIMVLLSVANSVNMSIHERVAEFGTMQALGNRARTVTVLILSENLILGLFGASLGVVLGIILASIVSTLGIPMPPPPTSDQPYTARILLTPTVVAGPFFIGLIATVAAALLPAWRIRRMTIVDALRQGF